MAQENNFPISHKIAERFFMLIVDLTDDEQSKLLDECKQFSSNNCWWVAYELRSVMSRLAADTQSQRQQIERMNQVGRPNISP